jgi:hypothetical protein
MPSDPLTRVTAPHDPKGRLISIFVGAVLLPSLALSYVSIEFVPQLAKANKEMGFKRAANTLADIERDLARAAQARAIDAAQAVGWERLLDGREHVIAIALQTAGLDGYIFDTLHLEGASSPLRNWIPEAGRSQSPRDILEGLGPIPPRTEDATPWVDSAGKVSGVLRFRFKPDFIRQGLCPYEIGVFFDELFLTVARKADRQFDIVAASLTSKHEARPVLVVANMGPGLKRTCDLRFSILSLTLWRGLGTKLIEAGKLLRLVLLIAPRRRLGTGGSRRCSVLFLKELGDRL